MVSVGMRILRDEGVTIGAGNLTFKRVFDELQDTQAIRITHASVIGRIWENQEAFQRDVTAAIALDDSSEESTSTLIKMIAIVDEADRSTIAGRWQAVVDLSRVVGESSLDDLLNSQTWPTWVGVWAGASSQPEDAVDSRLTEALTASYEALATNYAYVFEEILLNLGLRAKDPYKIRHLAMAIAAMAEGCALRDRYDRRTLRGIKRPTGPGGRSEEWTLFGIGIESLCRHMLEPIPRWKVSRR